MHEQKADTPEVALSLKDYHRIYILKGIYPRNPKKKPNASQMYYHVKDISCIANEPIIDYICHMKSFLKKISRANTRHKTSEVQCKWESKPEMPLDRLVKERFPTIAVHPSYSEKPNPC